MNAQYFTEISLGTPPQTVSQTTDMMGSLLTAVPVQSHLGYRFKQPVGAQQQMYFYRLLPSYQIRVVLVFDLQGEWHNLLHSVWIWIYGGHCVQ